MCDSHGKTILSCSMLFSLKMAEDMPKIRTLNNLIHQRRKDEPQEQ